MYLPYGDLILHNGMGRECGESDGGMGMSHTEHFQGPIHVPMNVYICKTFGYIFFLSLRFEQYHVFCIPTKTTMINL